MQFVVIGRDGDDTGALDRRLAVRADHLALSEQLTAEGRMWYAAALLDDQGVMNGSMLLMDFPDRAELDRWLETEPYVTGGVWKTVEIRQCSVRNPWHFSRPREFFER